VTAHTFTADTLDAECESVSPYSLHEGDVIADREHVPTLSGVGVVQRIEHGMATRVHVLVPNPIDDDDTPTAFYVHSTDRVWRVKGAHVERTSRGWSGDLRQRTLRSAPAEPDLYALLRFLCAWSALRDDEPEPCAFVRQYDETDEAWV